MKALLIGGTGTISAEISALAAARGWELTLLNRGHSTALVPEGARLWKADIQDEAAVSKLLEGEFFDVVADFIAYEPAQVERDLRLFEGKTAQYFFISTASAYRKPLANPYISEGTPLANPFWQYSRLKIDCEKLLMAAYQERRFPVTIIRPSHTYSSRSMPVAVHGSQGSFAVLERIRAGKKVIVPGDGLTLWTLTHSRDFAVAFCGLMGNCHAIGEVYQITGDESLTWNQIYECIGSALGVQPRLCHIASETVAALCPGLRGGLLGDKSNTVLFDNRKIKQAVPEFNAAIRFSQGAREVVDYVYSHPECQKPDFAFDAWCDALTAQYEQLTDGLPRFAL